MKVSLVYFAQIRQAAGTESEILELPDGADLAAAVAEAAARHGAAFRTLTLDKDGAVRPSLLVTINNGLAPRGKRIILRDGDEISLMSPIAGG